MRYLSKLVLLLCLIGANPALSYGQSCNACFCTSDSYEVYYGVISPDKGPAYRTGDSVTYAGTSTAIYGYQSNCTTLSEANGEWQNYSDISQTVSFRYKCVNSRQVSDSYCPKNFFQLQTRLKKTCSCKLVESDNSGLPPITYPEYQVDGFSVEKCSDFNTRTALLTTLSHVGPTPTPSPAPTASPSPRTYSKTVTLTCR